MKRRDRGFTRRGFVCQALAVSEHDISRKHLREMADRVGRGRIQVLHGTDDRLITLPHAGTLVQDFGMDEDGKSVNQVLFEGRRYYLLFEERERFRRVVEQIVERAESLQ